ncbi:MAG: GntR family transcriptional regulator [Capsulimonadaceae bacterium]|nr:GntR family transcriptional regulator [Capsulimonadaceae bacterium]
MRTIATKHEDVRKRLEAAIRSGQYLPGEQLPAEQDLATQYGVSFPTARRAVSDLVASDVLERRGRKGTFVRRQLSRLPARKTLNLITSAYEGNAQRSFIAQGMVAAEAAGLNANIIRLANGQQDSAVRVIRNGELAIVTIGDVRPTSALGVELRAANGRAVVMYPDMSEYGVPTVQISKSAEFNMAFEHLKEHGHKRIAVVAQFPSECGNEMIPWEREILAIMEAAGDDFDLVRVDTPVFHSPTKKTYARIQRYLAEHPETTAFTTMGDELALGLAAACRDAKRPVGQSISLVNIGDSDIMEFMTPAITCVDENLASCFDVAIGWLTTEGSSAGHRNAPYYVQSRLVQRGSVISVRQ